MTLQALQRIGALRTGADIAEIAWTAHRIVISDPRLLADTRSAEVPDPASVSADDWRDYWLRWPLSAWAGQLSGSSAGWFRIDGRRFVPTFRVAADVGATFDAMVEEIVDYRLARYLFTKRISPSSAEQAFKLKVIQARGRPILMFDRNRNPGLREGETPFVADGALYTGDFVKIALNVARRQGNPETGWPICCDPGSAPTRVNLARRNTSSWFPGSRTGRCGQRRQPTAPPSLRADQA